MPSIKNLDRSNKHFRPFEHPGHTCKRNTIELWRFLWIFLLVRYGPHYFGICNSLLRIDFRAKGKTKIMVRFELAKVLSNLLPIELLPYPWSMVWRLLIMWPTRTCRHYTDQLVVEKIRRRDPGFGDLQTQDLKSILPLHPELLAFFLSMVWGQRRFNVTITCRP